jgi:hypothetical protein
MDHARLTTTDPVPTVGGGHAMLTFLLVAYILFPDVVAQTAADIGPLLTALNLGLAGIGLWAFTTGKIVAHGSHQNCIDKLAAAEAELRRRNDETMSTVVPLMVRVHDTLARILDRAANTPPPPSKGDNRR